MAGAHPFTKPGGTARDLDRASNERLDDAEALFVAGRYAAAIAMGLYALEIRLKVVICKKLDLPALPRGFETHDLGALLVLTGLSNEIKSVKRPRAIARNWDALLAVSKRAEDLRYKPDPNWDGQEAGLFLERLRNPPAGVLLWLSRQA